MDGLLAKANLVDQRIEQLRNLLKKTGEFGPARISPTFFRRTILFSSGPIDPNAQIRQLEQENQSLKQRIQSLVDEMTKLEKQQNGKQNSLKTLRIVSR